MKKHNLDESIALYQALLERMPDDFAARFYLGCALMEKGNMDGALTEFLLIAKSEPTHFETQCNIAACYLKKGSLSQAKTHYLSALELMPDDTQVLFNLGVIDAQLGNIDVAIRYYQKAIHIQPDFFEAHNNVAAAFLVKQHAGLALHHFQEAARLQPDNSSLQYTIQALSQNQQLLAAPTDYIKSLFDSYADHYDQHLVNALDYQVPIHFQRVLTDLHLKNKAQDVLDIGCGTGLCGGLVKPFAKTLTGVDLSKKMLEMAREKNFYDELVCEDFYSFLTNKNTVYDLIMAGDVLVYIGDLGSLFQHVQHTLRANGLFIFNTEISETDDYKMNQSGRFAHQKKYIERLAKQNQLAIVYHEKAMTRMQNNEPVYGYLYVLQRSEAL